MAAEEHGIQRDEPKKILNLLVVDDDESVRRLLETSLRRVGCNVIGACDGGEAIRLVRNRMIDVVLLDINMPGLSGVETLREIRRCDRDVTVVMVTGYATVQNAVDAMKCGADEFIMKPFTLEAISGLLRSVEQRKLAREALKKIEPPGEGEGGQERLIAHAPVMRKTLELVDRIAQLPSTVLIVGESGTGKELIARRIHMESPRAQNRFVAFNCAVIPQALLESELFGYEKGAFTGAETRKIGYFEAAKGGTIFIDEISEMSPDLQTKLLRVIQEHTFRRIGGIEEIPTDARLIAATNRDLEAEVAAGSFRKDLYYRINVVKVEVPPLRERRDDIPLLCRYFIRLFSRRFAKEVEQVDQEVLERFMSHRWDGNVRELQNLIERAVAMANGRKITLADLPEDFSRTIASKPEGEQLKPFQDAKLEFEAEYLARALEQAHGNIALASRLTGISRQHLYEKLGRLGLQQEQFRGGDEGME